MSPNRLLVLAIALVILSAGCLGGGGAPGSADGADSSTSSGSGGAAAPEADASDPEDVDDLELTDAEAALRDAGSFTATWTYRGTDVEGTGGAVGYTYYADLDGDRAHVLFSTSQGDGMETGWEQFSTGDRLYMRYGTEAGAFYQVQDDDLDVVGDAISHAGVYAHGDVSDLSRVGTEQYDGVTVTRYELSEAQSMFWTAGAAVGDGSNTDLDVTDFEYVVLIDDDGLSRYESWSYTGTTSDGRTVSGQWEYSLTDVGSTSFDDPEWLAEADAQAQQT
jgi:hypothetical protein